jgi:hypothetical protein
VNVSSLPRRVQVTMLNIVRHAVHMIGDTMVVSHDGTALVGWVSVCVWRAVLTVSWVPSDTALLCRNIVYPPWGYHTLGMRRASKSSARQHGDTVSVRSGRPAHSSTCTRHDNGPRPCLASCGCGSRRGYHWTRIFTRLALVRSLLGRTTRKTPCWYLACALSGSTSQGSWSARAKVP